jgi:hypothetical protein
MPGLVSRRSTSLYVVPFTGAGGRGSPFTEVTSGPLPPRGPICWYRPDCGTVSPGFNPLWSFHHLSHRLMPSNKTHCRDRTCAAIMRGRIVRISGRRGASRSKPPTI